MKLKTPKAISKRFTKTKNGKLLHRASGQDHFNSRESGTTTRRKRRDVTLAKGHAQNISKLI